MQRYMMFLGLVGLTACGGKDDDGTGTGTDTDTNTTACTNAISETYPADGEAAAFFDTTVEFTLTAAEADATISVADASGADVAGATSVDGTRVIFTPSAGFASSTTYTATLSYSCGDAPITFTTSDVGDPVSDPSSLVGNVYNLDLANGRFVEPAGVGDLIGSFLTVSVLMEVTSADASSVTMMGAIGDGATQDMCSETIDFPTAADFSANPLFVIGPETTTLEVAGYSVTIDDLMISGAFAADGSSIEGASLAGSIDTRPLAPLAGVTGDSGVCDLITTLAGIPCIECGDGSGPYCLAIEVQDIGAELVPGLDLMPVTAADVAANGTCATTGT